MNLSIAKEVLCRVPQAELEKLLDTTLKKYGRGRDQQLKKAGELSLVLVGEQAMKKLNNFHRAQNKTTDVLSFDYGEIIICWPVAVKQAVAHGLSVNRELKLLFVHGLLHVLGYDHESAADNAVMRAAETNLLGYNGLVDIAHKLGLEN